MLRKSIMCASLIAFVINVQSWQAFANEPVAAVSKQLEETEEGLTIEEKSPKTSKSSKKTAKNPPQKLSLNYQINEEPIAVVESTEDKPFTLLLELFRKTLEAANKIPTQLVNTTVHIPYPEDMQRSFKEKLPNLVLQTAVETPNGKAKTSFNLAAFNGEIIDKTDQNKKGLFEWAGLNGVLNYVGELKNLSGDLNIPHISMSAENEFEILMDKFFFSAGLNEYYEPLHFDLRLPLLKIAHKEKHEDFDFNLNNLTAKLVSDDQEILEGLRLGRSEFSIDEMGFSSNKDQIVIKGLRGETSAKVSDPNTKKFTQVSSALALSSLTMPPSLANGLTGISFEIQTELNNFNSQVLADIKKTLRQLQTEEMSEEMMGTVLIGDLMKALPKIVKGSPLFEVKNISIKTNQGELVGSFSFGIDGTKPFSIEKIEVLKMAIKAQSHFKISKGVLKKILVVTLKETKPSVDESDSGKSKKKSQTVKPEKMAEEQIKQFLAQKFLIEEDKYYKLSAEFKAGKLFLNDQEIPLPF
ncbi:MAG: hypothetical protein RIT27_1864 [Pseudomonadota bacterium]